MEVQSPWGNKKCIYKCSVGNNLEYLLPEGDNASGIAKWILEK
jgi:hypothetical protein